MPKKAKKLIKVSVSSSFPPALGVTITDISFPSLLGDKGKSRECSDTVNRASPAPGKWSPLRADLCGSAGPYWSCPGRTTAHGKGRGSKGRCPGLSCPVQGMPQDQCCWRVPVTAPRAPAAALGGGSLGAGARGAAQSKALEEEEVRAARGRERETLKHAAITA